MCVLTPEQQQAGQQRLLDAWERLIAFFAAFSEEIVSLGKSTLRDVVNGNERNVYSPWLHAYNFFLRLVDKLTVEQQELLNDWQLVLCKSDKDTVVLLPGIRRCFDRVCAYLEDKKDDLIRLRQPTLVAALTNKTLSKEPLCVFTCCFLKRYAEQLPVDLKLQLEEWKQKICGEAVAESEAKREQRNVENFDSLIAFFADFAGEISGLEKVTLEEVVNSHRRNMSSRWKCAYEFLVRSPSNLTVEQGQLLADWELVLCKVDKDTVVLLPGIRRCFDRACAYLADKTDDLISLRQPTLVAALSNKSLSKEPLCVFTCWFLKRYAKQLPVDLKLQLEAWEQQICGVAASELVADREQQLVSNFGALLQFLADFAEDITGLEKDNLVEILKSNRRNTSARWNATHNFYVRNLGNLTVEQKELLHDWQLVFCKVDTDTAVLLPGIRRCFDRACAYLEDKKEDLISLRQPTLVAALSNKNLSKEPLCVFTCCFSKRYAEQLPVDLKLQLEAWEQEICGEAVAESEAKREQRNVDNFDSLIAFFGDFAGEITGLGKATLLDVAMSYRKTTSSRWHQIQEAPSSKLLSGVGVQDATEMPWPS